MTSFSEQFSAVRQSQWETQLDLFRSLSNRALENTEQLIALNMRASRASMEQTAGTLKQMLEASNPRDLLALGTAAQGQWHQLFAYGRELVGIASGMRMTWSTLPPVLPFAPVPSLPAPLRLIPAPNANLPATPSQAAEQAAIAVADAATVIGEIGAAAVDIGGAMVESTLDGDGDVKPSSEAVPAAGASPAESAAAPAAESTATAPAPESAAEVAAQSAAEPATEPAGQAATPAEAALAFADAASDTAIADDVPPLEATPLVQALNEVAPKPAGVDHPIVSTVPLEAAAGAIELPAVAPLEHTAPPAPPARAPRTSRKK